MLGLSPVSNSRVPASEPDDVRIARWRASECVARGIFWALIVGWLMIVAISVLLPSKPGFLIVGIWFLVALSVRAIQRFYGAKLEASTR